MFMLCADKAIVSNCHKKCIIKSTNIVEWILLDLLRIEANKKLNMETQ